LVYKVRQRNRFTTQVHEGLQTIFTENNVVAWKEYMKWNLLNSSTALLSTQIEELTLISTEKL
jgi:predicted metalloendopeptidase